MQTITINHAAEGEVTESTVLGPFFVAGSPEIEPGGDIAFGAPGEPCWVEGSVRDVDGKPIPGALLEVWQADDDGFYDVQYADPVPRPAATSSPTARAGSGSGR